MATQMKRRTARKSTQGARKTQPAKAGAGSQTKARARKTPGTGGTGAYYHVEVRPRSEFTTFRTQDVGRKGHIQRVAGRRSSGSWATTKWLISKDDAHVRNGRLVADSPEARKLLNTLGSTPRHTSGDRFKASDRPNVPERKKPTAAQKRARARNIRKAQSARRK
jgi:hypothetical protein